MDFAALLAKVDQHEGPFGDHLKRILVAVSQMPEVMDHRLLAASVVYQSGDNRIDFSSELYRRYLRMHLAR